MTLSIRPVRLKKSVYFRVPNDIADLINLEDDSQVTLTLEEKEDRHLLVYSVLKAQPIGHPQSEAYALTTPMQQSTSRARAVNKPL